MLDRRRSLETKALPWVVLATFVITLSGLWAADNLSPASATAPTPRVLVVVPAG